MASVSWTLWSVMITPMFLYFSLAMMCWMSSTAIGSTPAKGSSSRMNFGSMASALAISQRLRSPPDRTIPMLLRTLSSPNSTISDSILDFRSSLFIFDISITAMMFCSTVSFLKTEASCAR